MGNFGATHAINCMMRQFHFTHITQGAIIMTIIEKMARAIWNARINHDGEYRGNVDTPFDELSEGRRLTLTREASAAWRASADNFALVSEFHQSFSIPAPSKLSELEPDREKMRLRIDLEEFLELVDACGMELFVHGERAALENCAFLPNGKAPDPVEIADALGDGIYVKYGHAIERGIQINDCLAEIHRSNMSKLDKDGLPIYREDGKVLKGPNYSPPDIEKVLYGHS